MTKDEMAQAVELQCQKVNAIFQDRWEWGTYFEELSAACGLTVTGPMLDDGRKDKEHPTRKAFTRWLRKIIPEKDYSLDQVAQHKLQLVEQILAFKG